MAERLRGRDTCFAGMDHLPRLVGEGGQIEKVDFVSGRASIRARMLREA